MKIKIVDDAKIIMSNPGSKHNYFAWPSVTTLKDGRILVTASGFRMAHVCPFGKVAGVMSYDNGETYSRPMIYMDTVLDDRDAGLCPFEDSGLILTSFNLGREKLIGHSFRNFGKSPTEEQKAYVEGYLKNVSVEEEKRAHGSSYWFSYNNGYTFTEMHKSKITSPHGPIELQNGKILWIGRTYRPATPEEDYISVYALNPRAEDQVLVGKLPSIPENTKTVCECEPYMIETSKGHLIAHIRVHGIATDNKSLLTLYQSESDDGGLTWSIPHQITGDFDGAPAHLFYTPNGTLVSVFGCRKGSFGIYMIYSEDEGKTWSERQQLFEATSADCGYPMTTILPNGNFLTVFYAHPEKDGPANIYQIKWKLVKE